jgi:hypothetical protein
MSDKKRGREKRWLESDDEESDEEGYQRIIDKSDPGDSNRGRIVKVKKRENNDGEDVYVPGKKLDTEDITPINKAKQVFSAHHQPRQSETFAKNRKTLKRIRDVTGYIVLALVIFLTLLTSWIGLEEGAFPFNIDFVADIAYSRHRLGTPALALFFVAMAAVMVYWVQHTIVSFTRDGVSKTVESQFARMGKLRIVRPVEPPVARDEE